MKRPRLSDYKYNSGQGELAIVIPYLRDLEKYMDSLETKTEDLPVSDFRISSKAETIRVLYELKIKILKSEIDQTLKRELSNMIFDIEQCLVKESKAEQHK